MRGEGRRVRYEGRGGLPSPVVNLPSFVERYEAENELESSWVDGLPPGKCGRIARSVVGLGSGRIEGELRGERGKWRCGRGSGGVGRAREGESSGAGGSRLGVRERGRPRRERMIHCSDDCVSRIRSGTPRFLSARRRRSSTSRIDVAKRKRLSCLEFDFPFCISTLTSKFGGSAQSSSGTLRTLPVDAACPPRPSAALPFVGNAPEINKFKSISSRPKTTNLTTPYVLSYPSVATVAHASEFGSNRSKTIESRSMPDFRFCASPVSLQSAKSSRRETTWRKLLRSVDDCERRNSGESRRIAREVGVRVGIISSWALRGA